ncbi:MAG TPA: diacylglycerol kinase family protein [Gemmatimonadaceae bacterium]|nr:diacylglycerol kinase family protein [Gemmatimonadaceae bacterium]
MRVTLMHNPTAGSWSQRGDELVALVRAAGHEVTYQSTKAQELTHALEHPGDLMLIAGGDGTVTDVVPKILHYDVPVAILPVGTANNIASTLGVRGTPQEIAAGLQSAIRRPLDVATARGPWGAARFVESAGVGLFAAMLRDAKRADAHPDRGTAGADDFERGLRILQRSLSRARSVPRRVEADAENLSGSYLLVAVMNISQIGPRVELAPRANPGDGQLDIVLLREEDRASLGLYIKSLLQGQPAALPVRTVRARHIRLGWEAGAGHLDDQLWPDDARAEASPDTPVVEVEIIDPPLQVLVPAG